MKLNRNFAQTIFSVLMGLALLAAAFQPASVQAAPLPLTAAQGDGTRTSRHPQTGMLTFLGADPSAPIRLDAAMEEGLSPQARGFAILDQYGPEFGIQNPSEELTLMSAHETDGRGAVRYQQVYQDVPVMGGELIVNTDAEGALLSINGEISPSLDISTTPTITVRAARDLALKAIAEVYGLEPGDLTASDPALWIYDARLLNGDDPTPAHLVWRMEVSSAAAPIRELVLVNAQTGAISLHFNQVDTMWGPAPAEQAFAPAVVESEPVSPPEPVVAPVGVPLQEETWPVYFEVAIDEARGWIYGSDAAGGKIDVIRISDLRLEKSIALADAAPKGIALDPDGSELAVANYGTGNVGSILFINPDTGDTIATITPDVGTTTINKPWDVIYGRTDRLYSTGNPDSQEIDYIHVIDTTTYTEVGKSTDDLIRMFPSLAISSDKNTLYVSDENTLFVNDTQETQDQIYKYDITTDTPTRLSILPSSDWVSFTHFLLSPDESKIFTDSGQVWDIDLNGEIGSTGQHGNLALLPAHNTFAVSIDNLTGNDAVSVYSVEDYAVVTTYSLPDLGTIGPMVATSDGSMLFVTSSSGITSINLTPTLPGATDASLDRFVATIGVDTGNCSDSANPCSTMNYAIGQAIAGDTIGVAEGTYTGSGLQVVLIDKDVNLSGGWNSDFTTQMGYSTIDGQNFLQGVEVQSVTSTVERIRIVNGYILGSSGGGVANIGGTLTLNDVVISHNKAYPADGGGISNTRSGTLVINNSAIIHNQTQGNYGGGIHNKDSTLVLNNSTVSDNTADYRGGGIYGEDSTIIINYSTISHNTVPMEASNANGGGGGIYVLYTSVSLQNTILASNTSVNAPDCGGYSETYISKGHNIVGNTYQCSITATTGDQFNVDPQLGVLIEPLGVRPLFSTSPAIDHGDTSTCLASDQRHISRPQGAGCDIGAFEYMPAGPAAHIDIAGGNNQIAPPNFPFAQTLQVVIWDTDGDVVSNTAVDFTSPLSGRSATFDLTGTNTASVLSNDGGVAGVALTANNEIGTFTVTANASGIGSVTFNLQNGGWYVSTGVGSDTNDCKTPMTACATIGKAIDNALSDATIFVEVGTYIGSDNQVINLTKNLTLLGGWDSNFTTQTGYSTINGGGIRSGVIVSAGITANMQRFIVKNSWNNAIQKSGIANSGTLTLLQCEISNNSPSYRGGGIYNAGTLTLNDCVVKKNSGTNGGGIYNSGVLTISDSVIQGNLSGAAYGGGIYNTGTANISNSLVIGNEGFYGAGIYNTGTLNLSQVSVSENTSANGGGIWLTGSANIENSTIFGNTASGPGGGFYASNATVTLNNVTVSENSASSGGGIHKSGSGGSIAIKNTILGGNKITTGTGPDCNGAVVSNGYNILSSNSGCTITATTGDRFNVNPLLGVYLPVQGYQPLMAGSPAIDSANPATCLPTDQRGLSRVGKCDKGAYEYIAPGSPAQIAIAAWEDHHVAPNEPAALPLQAAVLDSNGSPVSGVEVTFTAPSSGPSGVFEDTGTTTTTATTDQTGMVTASTYTANSELGFYTITASASVGTAEFNFTNLVWFVSLGGSNENDCLTSSTPCADITGVFAKPGFYPGDVMWVASGTYDVSGSSHVNIQKNTSVVGGWNSGFTAKTGVSILKDAIWLSLIYPKLEVHLSNLLIENTGSYGIYNNGHILIVENSTIRNNPTGILNSAGGVTTVINTTISGNDGFGNGGYGGVYSQESGLPNNKVVLINSSVVNNKAGGPGGVTNYPGAGSFILINSVVIGNISAYGGSPDCYGTFISYGHNIIGNSSCTGDWRSTDIIGTSSSPIPATAVLDTTIQRDSNSGQWYHPLKFGSPAIDGGNRAFPGSGENACPATDQLGVVRPQGVYCDIGAVEFQFNVAPPNPLLVTYDAGNGTFLPGTWVCEGNNTTCAGGDTHEQGAQANAYSTFQWYQTWHGRNSLDGNGFQINSSVHYRSNYQNAFWNGYMVIYGDGYGFPLADDVVANELTHGVTQHESNLFYWYQSGAINESFSDLWGEAVDQANGLGNDTAGVRWLIGEDVTGLGAFRNMANPPAFNQPDSMTSTKYYEGSSDNGGVHTNSGVNNKAVYLMVDGGTFNSKTVSPLGWDKVLAIYYEAQTNLLTSGSDYLDLYNVLYQACLDKVGSSGIVLADCQEVRDATDTVKMNLQPAANFNPDADYCPTGTSKYLDLYMEDFETGVDGWTFAALSGESAWGPSTGYATSGVSSLWADDSYANADSFAAMSSGVALPAGSKSYLHFAHAYKFDSAGISYFDGGVLEYSTNNGITWRDAKPLYSAGRNYKGTLKRGVGNPLEGRSAFAADSHGYVDSRYKLETLAGRTIRFRWRMGTSAANSALGWFVDDVLIYTCLAIPKVPTLSRPASNALLTDFTPLFDWSDSTPDLHHYELQLATDPAFTLNVVNYNDIPTSTYTLTTDLTPGVKYYWRVRAYNAAGGVSAWSKYDYFRIAFAAPALLTPADLSTVPSRKPTFTWSAVTGATSYRIQISTSNTFKTNIVNTTKTTPSYTPISNLPAGTLLYWRVQVSGGTFAPGLWSTIWSFTTP